VDDRAPADEPAGMREIVLAHYARAVAGLRSEDPAERTRALADARRLARAVASIGPPPGGVSGHAEISPPASVTGEAGVNSIGEPELPGV
jgi:hypothetical protein